MKEDRRTKYTKMILRSSLFEILEKKPLAKITVKEICEKADVNRGTFYLHYSDAYDLFKSIEDEMFEMVMTTINSKLYSESMDSFLTELFNLIMENKNMCTIMFERNGTSDLISRILDTAREKIICQWTNLDKPLDDGLIDYIYNFVTTGSVGIISKWVKDGMIDSPEHIAELIDKLNSQGVGGFLSHF